MEGVGNDASDLVVDKVNLLPGRPQVEAAVHALDSEMVFLVDHQADLLEPVDRDAPRSLGLGMLPADELPLDEELPVDLLELSDVDVFEVLARR